MLYFLPRFEHVHGKTILTCSEAQDCLVFVCAWQHHFALLTLKHYVWMQENEGKVNLKIPDEESLIWITKNGRNLEERGLRSDGRFLLRY